MNLKTHIYLLLILVGIAFTACNQQSQSTTSLISAKDSMKIAFYDKYFLEKEGLNGNKLKKPVNPDSADLCISNFEDIKLKFNSKDIKTMLRTKYVEFNFKELSHWMTGTLNGVDVDSIRVCFGAYTQSYLDTYRGVGSTEAKNLNKRLSVFLWPYFKGSKATKKKKGTKQDELVEPFNLGNIHPNP